MEGPTIHKVLIVDDEHVITDTLRTIFTIAGYDVRAAYSAEEALELIRETKWIPQFTLLDVHLPGMNGIDLAVLLKAECPDCRVSLFSGYEGAFELLEQAAKSGHAFDLIVKPVHPSHLLDLVGGRPLAGYYVARGPAPSTVH